MGLDTLTMHHVMSKRHLKMGENQQLLAVERSGSSLHLLAVPCSWPELVGSCGAWSRRHGCPERGSQGCCRLGGEKVSIIPKVSGCRLAAGEDE